MMTVRVALSFRRVFGIVLLVFGLGCICVYSASLLYSNFHQAYENWRFDHAQASARPDVPPDPARGRSGSPSRHVNAQAEGSVVGRIFVPRLHLKAMVEEGVEGPTLLRAVGHVPGTAFPGNPGNVAIAGHRDSFFKALEDLKPNDEIVFETQDRWVRYSVDGMMIVDPHNTSVLAPTGDKTLTIVTCFPFHYVGPAPRRFIVRARQISELSKSSPPVRKSVAWRAENSHRE